MQTLFKYAGDQGFATSIAAACFIEEGYDFDCERDFDKVLEAGMELYCKMRGAAATIFSDGSVEHERVLMGSRGEVWNFVHFKPFQKLFKDLPMFQSTFALHYQLYFKGLIRSNQNSAESGDCSLREILNIGKNMRYAICALMDVVLWCHFWRKRELWFSTLMAMREAVL